MTNKRGKCNSNCNSKGNCNCISNYNSNGISNCNSNGISNCNSNGAGNCKGSCKCGEARAVAMRRRGRSFELCSRLGRCFGFVWA
jgi:hypothetical protein